MKSRLLASVLCLSATSITLGLACRPKASDEPIAGRPAHANAQAAVAHNPEPVNGVPAHLAAKTAVARRAVARRAR